MIAILKSVFVGFLHYPGLCAHDYRSCNYMAVLSYSRLQILPLSRHSITGLRVINP